MLVGRLFTDAGDRLIPSHTAKSGKRYRYYVSAPGAGRVVRFAARDLEQAVVVRLQEFFKSPKELLDVLKLGADATRQQQAVRAATFFTGSTEDGTVANRADALLRVVDRVLVRSNTMNIKCSSRTLRMLLLADTSEGGYADVPFALELRGLLHRTGRQVRLVLGNARSVGSSAGPDAALVKAAARSRLWYERLTSGRHFTC